MNLSRRFFLTFVPLTLAACVGCQRNAVSPRISQIERLNFSDAELRQILAHSPSDEIEQTLQKVSRVLNLIYAERMPEYLPNWIAFHALLMHGSNAYPNWRDGNATDENLDRIFAVIQHSNTQEQGSFILRSGLPYPRQSGPNYFMLEHHPDQFLLYFGKAGGTLDAPLTIDDVEYTFYNVMERSLLEARTTSELAFTVSAYTKFLEQGKTWQNKFGETMSLAMLLEKLLDTPERTCYGTHRLGALAKVYARKEFSEDRQIGRLWSELERQVLEALVMLKQSQRPDGSFESPGIEFGSQTKEHCDIYFTGHSLEWITFLGEDYCRDDWVVRAVDHLAGAVEMTYRQTYRNLAVSRTPDVHFDFGGLSHAVSALKRWHDQTKEPGT
ncbi:MAG: hypothetical protein FWE95_00220 [Planctomycetaceae bacterium]|nr:hypothetical protein [Planctomycetaceae bacterium]